MADIENVPQTTIGSDAPDRHTLCLIETLPDLAATLAALLSQLERLLCESFEAHRLYAPACAQTFRLPRDKALTQYRSTSLRLGYSHTCWGELCGQSIPSANPRPPWSPLRDRPHRPSPTRCPIGSG